MTLAAATRFCICELGVLLACGGVAQAQTAAYDLSVGAGWISNPFFDDIDLQAVAPVAGPAGRLAAAGALDLPLGGRHVLRLAADGRLEQLTGDTPARTHRERLSLGWRWAGAEIGGDVTLRVRNDAIDRFPTDDRQAIRLTPGVSWAATPWLTLRTEAYLGGRRFPERTQVAADGGAQQDLRSGARVDATLGAAILGATRWWVEIGGGGWQIDSNADGLDRQAGVGDLLLIGRWRQVSWDAFAGAWALTLPTQNRVDVGRQFGGGIALRFADAWSVRADVQHIESDSDAVSGRFVHWQSGLSLTFRGGWRAANERRPLGVRRLADGRWRFVTGVEGERVSLVGDFNGWQAGAAPMRKEGNRWVLDIKLPPGRQTFMFHVDGRFTSPDFAPRIDDGFGRQVGLLWVAP